MVNRNDESLNKPFRPSQTDDHQPFLSNKRPLNRSSPVLSLPSDPCPIGDYLPIASLLLPILGSQIHGSISDWQHLLILVLILHFLLQVIRLPSSLLKLSSRLPTTPATNPNDQRSNNNNNNNKNKFESDVRSELKLIESLAFVFLMGSPLVATSLIRVLQETTLDGGRKPSIDPFASRMCFIAVSLRPIGYLIKLMSPSPDPSDLTGSPRSSSSSSSSPGNNNSLGDQMKVKLQKVEKMVEELKSRRTIPLERLESVQASIQGPLKEFRTRLIKDSPPSSSPGQTRNDSLVRANEDSNDDGGEEDRLIVGSIRRLEDRIEGVVRSVDEQVHDAQVQNSTWILYFGQTLIRTGMLFQRMIHDLGHTRSRR